MGVTLPGYLDEALDLIGVSWPNVDEDDYREMAQAMREFADDVDDGAADAHAAIMDLIGANEGMAVEALDRHWSKVKGSHLANLAEAGRLAATALDGVAALIEGAKLAAIAQLGILAAEIAAAVAAAPVTLGLSTLGGLAGTQACRIAVKRILKEVCEQVVEQIVNIAMGPVYEALGSMTGDLVVQLGGNALGVRDGVDLGQTAKAGREGLSEGVDGTKSAAKGAMQIDSAGGGGGGSGGGGGGRFSMDLEAYDRAGTGLTGAGGKIRDRAGGKVSRARSSHGRTRGKDAIADAANAMLDKVIDGIEQGVKTSAKHLDDNMTRGLKTMARNHEDNDRSLAEGIHGIGKGGKGDPSAPGGGISLASAGKGSGRGGRNEPSLSGPSRGGQSSGGNSGCQTAGDPVDVVSGQMITSATDVRLYGLLPLVLRRAYASGYPGGRLHGPGWSCTVDQRIEIDAHQIHYAGDDAQILHYPRPAAASHAVLPADGPRWPLTWDPESDTVRIEDPATGWTRHFAPSGRGQGLASGLREITELTDRNDNRLTFVRDEAGAPTEVRHSCGYRVAVDTMHTAAGPRIEALRLLDGTAFGNGTTIVGYEYYPDGRLAGVINSSGLPYEYEYDDADRITTWIDRTGQSYTYVYDDQGRVVRGAGEDGHLSAQFHYDTARRVTTVTDSLGHADEYHYDENHRVIRSVDPLGHTTLTEYDTDGRVVARTDEIGRTTRFDLDDHGDPIRVIEPDGGGVELAYSELRQLASVRRGGTALASFTYDTRGNLLTTTDATGARTRRQYDDHGRLVSVTDPLGQTRQLQTNPAGLITAVTDGLGHTARVTYDAFGRVVAFTDPLGATTRMTRRVEGEITERIHPDGTSETWTYDPEGNVTEQRDQAGAVTRYEIGPFGRPVSRTQPDGEELRFSYDTELRLLSVTLGETAWTYEYDAAGHLVGETDLGGRTLAYRRDGADQLLAAIDASGRSTAYTYDLLGQMTERRTPDATVTSLTYDDNGAVSRIAADGHVVEYTYDGAGRVLSETVDGRTTTYTYDALGRRTGRTTPTGIVSRWTYDANNQPVDLSTTLGRVAFSYDAGGREITRYLGDGAALTQTWDDCNRLTGQSIWAHDRSPHTPDTGPYTSVQERTYGYRADGIPTTVADRLRGRRDFDLSPAGRITQVNARSWSESYAYDPLGNITRAHDTRTPDSETAGDRSYTGSLLRTAGRTSYEYDDQGRLIRRLVRTLSGQRREWRYTWNAEDQLTRVDTPNRGSWTYRYDPLGRRTAKQHLRHENGQTVTAEQVVFVWDGTQLIEQYTTGADGTRLALTWDWEPGTWKPLSQTERTWSTAKSSEQSIVDQRFHAIVTDLSDTPSELVTTDGQVIWSQDTDLWGRRTQATANSGPTCPLGRPGQYHDDETGLEYNYFRYYDPATGRYLTTDPVGLAAGPNPHAYVPNPLVWIDPLGLARQPSGMGGWYGKLQPANWTDGSDNTSYEINHVPAKATYLNLGLPTDLKESTGPSMRMEYDDHRNFISTGSGRASDLWRAKQTDLIKQGKFDEAMKMDIDEIRRVHGTKYDAAIKEMVDSLPNNRKFQKYLADNGWKIRTCLLQ
jgi:RHS repeat-associated protein